MIVNYDQIDDQPYDDWGNEQRGLREPARADGDRRQGGVDA